MNSRKRSSICVRRLVAGAATIALLLSACGGSDGAASAASWCDFVDEADVVDATMDSLFDDPSNIEAGTATIEGFVNRLPDEAPDAIAADAKTVADGTQQLVDALKNADYSLLDADLTFMQDAALEADLDQAGENLDAFTEKECGRPFGRAVDSSDSGSSETVDSSDSGEFDPSNGTLREQLVTQFTSIGLTDEEAQCIADNLDFNDPAVQSGDIASMLDVFDQCGIGIDRLAELGQD